MKTIQFFSVLTGVLMFHQISVFGTPLSDLVSKMNPGSWGSLSTNNICPTLRAQGASGIIFGFTEDIKWDPNTQQLLYMGADHGDSTRFVTYSASTNNWRIMPKPSWIAGPTWQGHGYDHSAINLATGDFYHRPIDAKRLIHQYNTVKDFWRMASIVPNFLEPSWELLSPTSGLEYFPEMKGLVLTNSRSNSVFFFGTTTGKWLNLFSNYQAGPLHDFAEYNPVHKVMICGGGDGSRALYKIDSLGKVTTLGSAPIDLGIQHSVNTVDPVSGDYLVFTKGGEFYVYDVLTDSWTRQPGTVPIWSNFDPPVHGVVASPVGSYGVNIFVTANKNAETCKVNVYKHSPSSLKTASPTVFRAVSAIQVSPNPFSSKTRIRFPNPGASAEISIYNASGELVQAFRSTKKSEITWDSSRFRSGFYVAKVKTGKKVNARKLFLFK